jgi:AcrR family transcriptional regulator
VGYKIFADEGPEGIQVERLARMLGVSKSSFYHFFVDKEIFVSELIKLHLKHAQRYVAEIKKLDNFDPEFIDLLVAGKEIILFHRQLN